MFQGLEKKVNKLMEKVEKKVTGASHLDNKYVVHLLIAAGPLCRRICCVTIVSLMLMIVRKC